MARLKGLTKNQLTILSIGCGDSAEGPYISMPDGKQIFLKASQLVWLARQVKSLAEGYEEVPDDIVIDDPDEEEPEEIEEDDEEEDEKEPELALHEA